MKIDSDADRVTELARRWRVAIDDRLETRSSVIVRGRRGTERVVLKVVKQPGDEWRSGEVLAAFGGRGVVPVYEYTDGAVLMPQLDPGAPLVELVRTGRDAEATDILADVIASMTPDAAPSWCPTATNWGGGFARYLATTDAQIARDAVERADGLFAELSASQREPRLLHGDLQHYNVLHDARRGWLAIDPKGVVAELEYELGAALRNPTECRALLASPTTVERRVALFASRLGLPADRILRWAYAQGVLSAIWDVEDGYPVLPDNSGLVLARTIEPILDAHR